jgi:hypothetical protein
MRKRRPVRVGVRIVLRQPHQRADPGIDDVEPLPAKAAAASYTSATTNVADKPSDAARAEAAEMAGAEKSSPLTNAPRRAQDKVSSPIWHCRWTSERPDTEPTSDVLNGRSEDAPARNPARS